MQICNDSFDKLSTSSKYCKYTYVPISLGMNVH